MHRFIIYQYGKVGSTSIVNALNELPASEAYQSHFLGEEAFSETLKRLQDPSIPDYFFNHSCGQLIENLKIYRHYLRREEDQDKLTMISLAREPFDWFRSCIAQDIEQHLASLKIQLQKKGVSFSSDSDVVKSGMALVFRRLLHALQHFGSVDELGTKRRFSLGDILDTADQKDFRSFMFFLHMFIRPHVWFSNHFQDLLKINIRDLEPLEHGVFRHQQEWGGIYLMRYEDLTEGFPLLLKDLGYQQNIPLPRENISSRKPFHEELEAAFATDEALELSALCTSEDTRFLGY